MGRILLVSSNREDIEALVSALERRRHAVTVCTESREAVRELKRDHLSLNVVVLDLSANRPDNWATLDEVRSIVSTLAHAPRIVSFSTVNRGPQMRLKAERKGGRFTYEP